MFRCRFVSPLVAIATRVQLPVPNAATITMFAASDVKVFSRRLCALGGPHGSTEVGHGLPAASDHRRAPPAPSAQVYSGSLGIKLKSSFSSSSHPSGASGCLATLESPAWLSVRYGFKTPISPACRERWAWL